MVLALIRLMVPAQACFQDEINRKLIPFYSQDVWLPEMQPMAMSLYALISNWGFFQRCCAGPNTIPIVIGSEVTSKKTKNGLKIKNQVSCLQVGGSQDHLGTSFKPHHSLLIYFTHLQEDSFPFITGPVSCLSDFYYRFLPRRSFFSRLYSSHVSPEQDSTRQ